MKGKRVLVTGSSRGIGRAIALKLASDGWSVAIHASRDQHGLDETARNLGSSLSGSYLADLSHPEEARKLFHAAVADDPIHAIVNNAGVYMPVDFAESSDNIFEANTHKTFAVNFFSPLYMIHAATKYFAEQGGGSILNVTSRVGFRGEAGAAQYAASKSALINLTRSLAVELAPKNIRLFAIAPGWVETSMVRKGMEERLTEILAGIPLGRMATVYDCAEVVSFLLSDAGAYLSGQTIDINGASYFH